LKKDLKLGNNCFIMLSLTAQIRKETGKKVKKLREKGFIPAVLYGPGIKNLNLSINLEEFEKIYKTAKETTLIHLEVPEIKEKHKVLIHEVQHDPLSGKIIHVDFYQPLPHEEVEIKIPLVFEGVAPAVKQLGGVLVKNLSELEIKGRIDRLPKEIKVNVESLKDFNTVLKVRDLTIPEGVKVLRNLDDIVAFVSPPEAESEETKPKETTETNV
jgi:large subunit ribosomal protein L25